MSSLIMNNKKQEGFIPILILFGVVAIISIAVTSGIVLTNKEEFKLKNIINKEYLSNNDIKTTQTPESTSIPTPTPVTNTIYVPTIKPSPTIPPPRSVTVSGFAYEDRTDDGLYNSDDPKLPNMSFNLYDSYDPNIIRTGLFSDSNGNFTMTLNVRGGIIIKPNAYNNFTPKTGSKTVTTSTNNLMFGFRSISAPVPNQNTGIIEGNVFHDGNRNGVRDSGENSVYFYKLYLISSSGNYYNTEQNAQTTDEGGHFKYVNLPVPNTYKIQLSNPTGAYEITRAETSITLSATQTESKNIEIPVYKY